ncbi:MAG: hypothetical protein Q9201_006315 [Fulgogasparrea decipioides]
MSGMTIRQALTLGLHLRNEDPKLADTSKEIRYRVWWAVANTERTLAVMTGRPTSFSDIDCSVPLPLPLDEETFLSKNPPYDLTVVSMLRRLSTDESTSTDVSMSTPSSAASRPVPTLSTGSSTPVMPSLAPVGQTINPNHGSFFLYSTKLSGIADDVVRQLYRPAAMAKSWAGVQSMILRFQKKLGRWHAALPDSFDFVKQPRDQRFFRQRMCLGFAYYSTMMVTNRPCLCKVGDSIPNESDNAKDIDQASAGSCILAARSLIDLLPDKPNPTALYQASPWWNVVHHLMQAVVVLMLEMSFRGVHCPDQTDELMRAAEKAVGWLQSMATDDMAAARAWRHSSDLLRRVAPRIGRRIDERLIYPVHYDEDMSMEDFLQASTPPPVAQTFTNFQPVTTWEPLMFTSYDNYLRGQGHDTSAAQPPSQREQQPRQS